MKSVYFWCPNCNGFRIEANGAKEGTYKCRSCGAVFFAPSNPQSAEIVSALGDAFLELEGHYFDRAAKAYEIVLRKEPNELCALEGALMARFGVEMVEDKKTERFIPTCHRAQYDSILDDKNYLHYLEVCADDKQRQAFVARCKEIDRVQKGIHEQLKNEKDYDVFISFKATDNGEPTEDSVIARDIYDELVRCGYRVFFSPISLERRIGADYESIIFRALYSCRAFVLVGTKSEYINSVWVRNEWSRFIERVADSTDSAVTAHSFVPVFKSMRPHDMPTINGRSVQGVDGSKIGFVKLVSDGIGRLIAPKDSEVEQLRAELERMNQQAENERVRREAEQAKREAEAARAEVERLKKGSQATTSRVVGTDSKEISDLEYQIKGRGVAITKYKGNADTVKVPENIEGKPVTEIGVGAFMGCSSLKSIDLPASLTLISYHAFNGCSSLKSIIVPKGVKVIQSAAFYDCVSLENIAIEGDLTALSDCVFYNCRALKQIDIPKTVTQIAKYAFAFCSSLKQISIPDNVEDIAESCFYGCFRLESIKLPSKIREIGEAMFYDCKALTKISISNNIEFVGARAFYDCNALTEIEFDGTLQEWNKINICDSNEPLKNARVVCARA